MVKRKKRKKSEDLIDKRKNQILEAAIKVFSKKGFEGSTTREIAQKAHISEGTVFRYFKTKKDILLSLINFLMEKSLFKFLQETENCLDTREAIKYLLKQHYRLIVQNYELIRIIFYELQFHKDLRENFYKNVFSKIMDTLEKYVKETELYRQFSDQYDSRTITEAVLGIFMGVVIVRNLLLNREDFQDEDKAVSMTLDILLNGLKKRD